MKYCILAFVAGLILSSCVGCAASRNYRIEVTHRDVTVGVDIR